MTPKTLLLLTAMVCTKLSGTCQLPVAPPLRGHLCVPNAGANRAAPWSPSKLVLAISVSWLKTLAAATIALAVLVGVSAEPVAARSPHAETNEATVEAVDRLIRDLDIAAKHPAAQIASVLLRAYTAIKVYRLSKEVKGLKIELSDLHASVHAVLAETSDVAKMLERGEQLTAAALADIHARTDAHAVTIAAAEAEIVALKMEIAELERQQRHAAATAAALKRQINRSAKAKFMYFDPACGCRRDMRNRQDSDGKAAHQTR